MNALRVLDSCCCQGGAGEGYARAGYEVVGVDRDPQPRYPHEFIQADALDYIREHGHEYDLIHASPDCQGYSISTQGLADRSNRYDRTIHTFREALRATGVPYVIENVTGARPFMLSPMKLCGSMFGLTATDDDGEPLRMERHRWFESSHMMLAPRPCDHDKTVRVAGAYGGASTDKDRARYVRKGGYVPRKHVQEALLGIDWMTLHGLAQSLPPVYTEWVGSQLMPAAQAHRASRSGLLTA